MFQINNFNQLQSYALNANVQNVLRKHFHDRNVSLRKTNVIETHQIERIRFSYVQTLIITSREKRRDSKCAKCVLNRDFFTKCYIETFFRENACANCV